MPTPRCYQSPRPMLASRPALTGLLVAALGLGSLAPLPPDRADAAGTARATTRVTADATPDTLGRGEPTVVQGELYRVENYAPLANRLIRLQRRPAGSTTAWVTYAEVHTDRFGHFSHVRTADRSMSYRALYTGSRVYAPDASVPVPTRVTRGTWTRTTAWILDRNGRAAVRGRLRRQDTDRVLPGRVITIDRRRQGNLTWTRVGQRTTTSTGYFQLTDTRLLRECFQYRATFAGTSVYAGKSARATWKSC